MTAPLLADVHVTGTGGLLFLYALVLPVGLLGFAIARTSPRRRSPQSLSAFEVRIQGWLWNRQRTREGTTLGAAALLGACGCILSSLLPMATYTEYAMYPGDPFVGVQEIEPTAKGLALVIGLIVAVLSLRRAIGGEAVTVPICLLLTTLLGCVAALAVADVAANAATGADRFMSALTAGPALFLVPAASIVVWLACAADAAISMRRSFRAPGLSPSPPPLQPAASSAPGEYRDARAMAQSIASGATLIAMVLVGWLPALFLAVGLFLIAPNVAVQFLVGRRLRRRLRIDRASVAIVAASLVALATALGWSVVRPDAVFAVPSSAHRVSACGPSVTVPEVGNQVNRSIAGSTTLMTVGSKIYVEDSPVGSAALAALTLDGPDVVCAGGGSGFGEVVVATKVGVATLYVRTTDRVSYRVQVQVKS